MHLDLVFTPLSLLRLERLEDTNLIYIVSLIETRQKNYLSTIGSQTNEFYGP